MIEGRALGFPLWWGKRPHFSQKAREMGHPVYLDNSPILDDRLLLTAAYSDAELFYLNDFTAAVSSSLTSKTV
jgi:hypothetical protein